MPESTAASQRGNSPDNVRRSSNSAQPGVAGRWNNLIATNTAIAIGSRIHGSKAEIYVNGMRVKLGPHLTACPSIVIVNGEPKFSNDRDEILENPTVVVETVATDVDPAGRTQKLEGYLAVPSVKECLLIRSDEMRVEHYSRQNAKQWLYRIYDERDDIVSLDSVNCKLSVAEIYAQIKLKPAELTSKAVN